MHTDFYAARRNGHNAQEAEYFARRRRDFQNGRHEPNVYYAKAFDVTDRTIRRWNASLEASGLMTTAAVTYSRDNRGHIRTNPRHRQFLSNARSSHDWEKIRQWNLKQKQFDTNKWRRHFQVKRPITDHADILCRNTQFNIFKGTPDQQAERNLNILKYGLAAVEKLEALSG